MSKMHYRAVIEDARNTACTDEELEVLIGIFTYAVKRTASTLARKAWFDLSDFATARENGVSGFLLRLDRENRDGKDHWRGTFECSSKKLIVLGYLEKD